MKIRLATERDGEAIAAIYAPCVEKEATSFEIVAPDAQEMARRVAAITERTPWLVAEIDGDVAGYAYASRHRDRDAYQWSVEVSAYVHSRHHRRGVGSALYRRLFDVLRDQGFVNTYAGITLPNPRSVAFHICMGFEPVGVYRGIGYKFDKWHDVAWYELALRERTRGLPAPTPLPEIRERLGL